MCVGSGVSDGSGVARDLLSRHGGSSYDLTAGPGGSSGVMKRDVRILILGDQGVGKTSLILSLISEEFLDDVPHRAEEITIPPDVTAQHVPTRIVDFSFEEQREEDLVEEISRAHVICLVVSLDDVTSVNSARDYWLPLVSAGVPQTQGEGSPLHEHGDEPGAGAGGLPVILVGNKTDLTSPDLVISTHIEPMMADYPNIETFVACSAKDLSNVSEVFHYAQKAVLHPSSPLYNYDISELTMRAVRCLHRVFRLCDMDNDGLLSDTELNCLQVRVFGAPLDAINLAEVKTIISRHCAENEVYSGSVSDDGIRSNCITETGFLFLNTLFIQRGRIETTWSILRSFGYDDQLELRDDLYQPRVDIKQGSSVELSTFGIDFLTTIFHKHDRDRDGVLSPEELNDLFDVCPRSSPWGADVLHSVTTSSRGWIDLNGFLSQWTMTTYLDTPRLLEYLAYFGYTEFDSNNQSTAIRVTRPKAEDIATRSCTRATFLCHVIGPSGAGKSSFLQGLLGRTVRQLRQRDLDTELSRYAVNTLSHKGHNKFLIMHDFDVELNDPLSEEDLDCDVIVLMYDASDRTSFATTATLYQKYLEERRDAPESAPPVLIVGAKSDRVAVTQAYPMSVAQFCAKFRLPPPELVSSYTDIRPDVYYKVLALAVNPHRRRGGYSDLSPTAQTCAKATIAIGVIALSGIILYKIFKSR